MEETECEVDSVDSEDAIAGIAVSARNFDVVVGPAFETLDRPVGQHNPGEHAVEQEDDGVAYAGADEVKDEVNSCPFCTLCLQLTRPSCCNCTTCRAQWLSDRRRLQ